MGLKYYSEMKDAHLSDLLIQASIKTNNQLMVFYYSVWQDFPDTVRSTGAYNIIFYKGGPFHHVTHVTGPVTQPSTESDPNLACTSGMYLAHFRMLINELLNNDLDIVTDAAHIIILDNRSDVCMDNTGKDTNNTRPIARRINFVRKGENYKIHKIEWC